MRNFKAVPFLFLVVLALAVPERASGEGSAVVNSLKAAAKSKAALKLADILGAYLIGKSLDEAYKYATAPDPKKLDDSLKDLQLQNPDYSLMLGTLRRAARTDGTPVSRAEFEGLAKDLVLQLDHAQLNSAPKVTPNVQWNPSASPLSLPGYGVGITRSEMDNWLKRPRARSFEDPLIITNVTPRSLQFPLFPDKKEESVLAAKIVGAWSFSNRDNLGIAADVYIFHRNGNITEYKVLESDEIFSFNGTYTVVGNKLTVIWSFNGGTQTLSATIEEIDGGHLKYTADKGPLDAADPVAKTLTRISDVGHFSVVTIHNPIEDSNPDKLAFRYQIRWATVDGIWSPWENREVAAGDTWSIPYQGGFFCQISFDSSFLPQRQEKNYPLSFNVVASPQDTKLLDEGTYRVKVSGDDVDLVPEKFTQPTPGVR